MASHQEVDQQVWSNNLSNIQCWCILNGEFVQNNVNHQMEHTEVCKEISNLYGGINELQFLLNSAARQAVREVITSEVNVWLAKIESLQQSMLKCTSNEPKWSVIATRRRKRTTVKDQIESCDKVNPIPVIQNCFELLHKVEVKTNIHMDLISNTATKS